MKIDIGCGSSKKDGFVGIDIQNIPGVDLLLDLSREQLPFDDNSVSEVYSSHFFEHLGIDSVQRILEEIYRVCLDGSIVKIRVPHFSGSACFYEYHKTSFRYSSFSEFVGTRGMFTSPVRFRLVRRRINFLKSKFLPWNYIIGPLINIWRVPEWYEMTFLRSLLPAHEVEFVFKVVKTDVVL